MKKFSDLCRKIKSRTGKEFFCIVGTMFVAFMAIYGYLMFGYIMTTPGFTYAVF